MSQESPNSKPAGDRQGVEGRLARPGAVTYLHLAAPDANEAAAFYRDVFGWKINDPDGHRPSFDDPSGLMSGAWIRDQLAVPELGLLPYIYVDDVEEAVASILAHGGMIVTAPYPEGQLIVATFRDPSGNVLGLWHDTTRQEALSGANAGRGSRVPPVPEHLHTVTPRLLVPDPLAAIDFYITAFGAHEVGERHSIPDGTLVHAELRIGDSIVMIAEGHGYNAVLCTYWPDVDAAWERAVVAGAEIVHPLADRFYGERGGRLKDPFGQEWMLAARLESLSAAEIAARASAHDA